MPTGDGLLARLVPAQATIALDALASLCAAAQRHGNGVIEITSRGSLQIRGLTAASAPLFADAVARLGIETGGDVPVIADPLTGLDPGEVIESGKLAAQVRNVLAAQSFTATLGPKVSVVVDGGAQLHLDALAADVRLRALDRSSGALIVMIGAAAAGATALGIIQPQQAADVVARLLSVIAARGPQMRARDIIATEGIDVFRAAIAGRLIGPPPSLCARREAEPIGLYPLRSGRFALGIALGFGHADAHTLLSLVDAAQEVGAGGVRFAPGRALLFVALTPNPASALAQRAERLGFIVRAGDPRRRIVACAGAPICAAAEIPARTLAPLAAAVVARLDGIVHISGCAKRCAHKGTAAITVVGRDKRCDLFIGSSPAGTVPVHALPTRLAELVQR
jgi:precorrin-3B synthase